MRIFYLFALSIFISLNLSALSPVNKSFWSGLAIEGYDPVAYFKESKAIEGKKKFSFDWQGATWRFSSEENRKDFQRSPESFAPQYGGYCAYAVSQNSTAGIDPKQWNIIEGKLYLNYNKKINQKWLDKQGDYIKEADKFWPQLLGQ